MNGGSYAYYVRCRDTAGNATTADTVISFAVASPPPPDTGAPTVSVTAPAEGATIGGSVNVTASAADNVGVVGVQFLLDGSPLGTEDAAAPYAVGVEHDDRRERAAHALGTGARRRRQRRHLRRGRT